MVENFESSSGRYYSNEVQRWIQFEPCGADFNSWDDPRQSNTQMHWICAKKTIRMLLMRGTEPSVALNTPRCLLSKLFRCGRRLLCLASSRGRRRRRRPHHEDE